MSTSRHITYMLGLSVLSLHFSYAQILYQQTFNYPGGSGSGNTDTLNTAFGTNASTELTTGWAGFEGASATDESTSVPNFAVSDRQSPAGPTASYGFILAGAQPGPWIMATAPTGTSISASTSNLNFSWYQGDASAGDSARLAIEIGTQWYASVSTFSTSAVTAAQFGAYPGTSGTLQSYNFSTTAANWDLITFTPGTTLSTLGSSPGSNLSGNIVGFGFYDAATSSGNERFDSFVVSAPEPTPWLMLLTGLSVLGLAGRRLRESARTIH